ncbi:MAG: NADP-dependent oxidoreductase [Acidobacteriota bacterium]
MATVNRQIALAARPVGLPQVSDFQLQYSPRPVAVAGEVLVRSVFLSLDPYMRGRMNAAASYARPVAIGEVMTGGVVGLVVQSEAPEFREGDAVVGTLGWQEYAVAPARELRQVPFGAGSISRALGVLGMPGLTAYFGLLDIANPRRGETVVISGAAGAVGMIAGQIARIQGCRVVGVAGSDAKTAWLRDELGFDAAFNYKTDDLDASLQEHCPDGIDVYFDNVGGAITDAVMRQINTGARISLCGQISQYNLVQPEMGPRWLGQLTVKQGRAQGFLISSYADRFAEGLGRLNLWLKQGSLRYREDIAQGIEAAPQAFIGMLQGKNEGKQLVQLSES